MNTPDTLAIDIVLLPPEKIMKRCRTMNTILYRKSQHGFRFDNSHIPHLTLVQLFVRTKKLPQLISRLNRIFQPMHAVSLRLTGLESRQYGNGERWTNFHIQKSSHLTQLQHKVRRVSFPFTTHGNIQYLYNTDRETISPVTAEWIQQSNRVVTTKKYRPHITLGAGVDTQQTAPQTFEASRAAICWMGNYYTCRKILKEWTLK